MEQKAQGIAIQEIMSYDTPLFVWDVETWEDQGPKYSVPATSVPYWSSECGEIFTDVNDMESTFNKFYGKINEYTPRSQVCGEKFIIQKFRNFIGDL